MCAAATTRSGSRNTTAERRPVGRLGSSRRSEVDAIHSRLQSLAQPRDVPVLQRFFKTGPGEYGDGDVFLGIRMPSLRALVRALRGSVPVDAMEELLQSCYHEARMLALLLMVDAYQRGKAAQRERIFTVYLANTHRINNWDLVDLSAPHIVGPHLPAARRRLLDRLAASDALWERRIAMLATFSYIRQGRFDETLRLARCFLRGPHDLMHKATGWMLREVGLREPDVLRAFLDRHAAAMPRTMLRYAMERLPVAERRRRLEESAVARRGS